jgi:nitrite reductase (NADH) small subunit/3-phenylpropionate/trans-cinnamate dioxygenase ferredoxin subunit
MAWVSLCEIDEVPAGEGKYVEIDGFQLAVFMHDGKPFVMDNTCPHAGGSMSAGFIEAGCAVCPWHGWAFELHNGELRNSPMVTIPTYKTRLFERPGKPPLIQADLPMP